MAKTWVNRQLDAGNWRARIMLFTATAMCGVITLILLYTVVSPWLNGVARLDSAALLDRFTQGSFPYGELVYDQSLGEFDGFTLSSTSEHRLGMMGGGYIEGSLGTTTTETEYRVWGLVGDGYNVIYCTTGALDDVGRVAVGSKNRDVTADLIEMYAPGIPNVYVLFDADSQAPMIALIAALFALCIALPLAANSPLLRRRTQLGRRLAAMPDGRAVAQSLNEQGPQPVLTVGDLLILRDWLVVRSRPPMLSANGYQADIAPISDVESVSIEPDSDGESLWACKVAVRGWKEPVVAYAEEQEAAQLAAWHDAARAQHK